MFELPDDDADGEKKEEAGEEDGKEYEKVDVRLVLKSFGRELERSMFSRVVAMSLPHQIALPAKWAPKYTI